MSTAKRVRFDVAEDSDEEDATASKRGRTVLPAPKEPKAVSTGRHLGVGEAPTPAGATFIYYLGLGMSCFGT